MDVGVYMVSILLGDDGMIFGRHTDESGKEELVPFIVGHDNLDFSGLGIVVSCTVSPAVARQERLEAGIIVDSPIISLDTTICRRNPQDTLISSELCFGRT